MKLEAAFEGGRGSIISEIDAVERFDLETSAGIEFVLRWQGWRPEQGITMFTDGDFSVVEIVCQASQAPLTHLLDWFHVSMRVHI